MNKTQSHSKAAKARRSWQLLQEEQRKLDKQKESSEKTIPLKVAHKRHKPAGTLADSA